MALKPKAKHTPRPSKLRKSVSKALPNAGASGNLLLSSSTSGSASSEDGAERLWPACGLLSGKPTQRSSRNGNGSNPVWSHHSIVCTGEAYKNVVKLTFARGASIPDPSRLFNSSLGGNTRRALDIHEGEKVDADEFKALVKAAVAQNRATLKKAKRAEREAKPVKLLTGGNPQIAKADGDAPVQSYIAAMPGWMREVGRRLDMLIARDSRRAQRSQMELSLLRCRGQRLVCHFPYLYELREGNLFPRHVAPTRSTRREIQGCALDRYPQGRFRRGADGKVDPPGGRRARLGQVVVDVRGSGRSLSARRHRREKICRVVLGVTAGRTHAEHDFPKSNAHCYLPLRRDSNSRCTNVPYSDELQLFDLPPLRRALGILRGELGEDRSSQRRPCEIFVEPEDSGLLPVQEMRLRYSLRVPKKAP